MLKETYFTGKLLVAMPEMDPDPVFGKSVIYLAAHDEGGAIGVIVNRVIGEVDPRLVLQNANQNIASKSCKLHFGGPVESDKGFILHSKDYNKFSIIIGEELSISANDETVRDIMTNQGPKDSILLLGYSAWAPSQLEEEIKNNIWLVVPFNYDIIFSEEDKEKWEKALSSIGISSHSLQNVGSGVEN